MESVNIQVSNQDFLSFQPNKARYRFKVVNFPIMDPTKDLRISMAKGLAKEEVLKQDMVSLMKIHT